MLLELDKSLQEHMNEEDNITFRELVEEIPHSFMPLNIPTDYVEVASTPRDTPPGASEFGSNYPRFTANHTSLMSKYLSEEIYDSYVGKRQVTVSH